VAGAVFGGVTSVAACHVLDVSCVAGIPEHATTHAIAISFTQDENVMSRVMR